ncbi:thiamine phosphate synthase [Mechercharimyces sp. CAU 1602]|uniref:thiamine phosphate synthase n=1 Tax=Mechercharimyces sp. CAU 1602 TaxID=2973933 RepID=UPI0021639179|nr:thiamine phosphate synthase [Mechercharimyces sp. CAU 1602]MCS1350504.1 thiamine phosphate synthase [Mechercharimyces sp. CAU 1602]
MRIDLIITDRCIQEGRLPPLEAVAPYVDRLQLRLKHQTALLTFQLGARLLETGWKQEQLLINDRIDIARALGCGVHLPERGMSPPLVRRHSPYVRELGVSVHSLASAHEAQRLGADYVTFGHVYATPSKPGLPARGVDMLRQLVTVLSIPVLAIGGVSITNLAEVAAAGASGVAVISAILQQPDIEEAAHRLWIVGKSLRGEGMSI